MRKTKFSNKIVKHLLQSRFHWKYKTHIKCTVPAQLKNSKGIVPVQLHCRKSTVPVHVQSIVQSMKRRAGPIGVHEIPSSPPDVTQGK